MFAMRFASPSQYDQSGLPRAGLGLLCGPPQDRALLLHRLAALGVSRLLLPGALLPPPAESGRPFFTAAAQPGQRQTLDDAATAHLFPAREQRRAPESLLAARRLGQILSPGGAHDQQT